MRTFGIADGIPLLKADCYISVNICFKRNRRAILRNPFHINRTTGSVIEIHCHNIYYEMSLSVSTLYPIATAWIKQSRIHTPVTHS